MRKRKVEKNPLMRILALALAISLVFSCVNRLYPYIQDCATHKAKSVISNVIFQTAYTVFDDNAISYGNFADIVYNESSYICSIEMKSSSISKIQSLLSCRIYDELEKLEGTIINISLGDISGFYLLHGKGIDMDVKIDSVDCVLCNIESDFSEAGVNQTCHSIYFDISVEICLIFPLKCIKTNIDVRYLAAQTVIVGDVPQVNIQKN